MAGYGINIYGESEAWVAHIPEPASLALLAAVLALYRPRRTPRMP